jgi:hypothetical protein
MSQQFSTFLKFCQTFFNFAQSEFSQSFFRNLCETSLVSGTRLPLPALEYKSVGHRVAEQRLFPAHAAADKKQSYAAIFLRLGTVAAREFASAFRLAVPAVIQSCHGLEREDGAAGLVTAVGWFRFDLLP